MGFSCKFIRIVPLLQAMVCVFVLLLSLPVSADRVDELEITVSYSETKFRNPTLQSFDINKKTGQFLLLYQDDSTGCNCIVQIHDLQGHFIYEYIVSASQTGNVLAYFSDNGEVVIYFVRESQAYMLKEGHAILVTVSEELLHSAEVPSFPQTKQTSHVYQNAEYILSSPNLLDMLFLKKDMK